MTTASEWHECTLCKSKYTEGAGGCEGELGIIPVSFCPFCLSGLVDMVEQLQEEWAGQTEQTDCDGALHQPA